MSHIFEGYFARTMDSDLADGIAETVLKSVMKNLPIALKEPDNYSARANLMADANVACSGIPEYGKDYTGWPCHAIEHELSAYYDITHGVGLAILTPRWMRFILKKDSTTLERFERFGKNVMGLDGSGLDLANRAIDKLEEFYKDCGIPMSLSELNINDEHFKEMAVHANINDRLKNAYVSLSVDDVEEILRACL